MTSIPKRLGHIWIGPKPAPVKWMRTWPEKHPGWEYTIYDNDFLVGHDFRLRRLIDEYIWRGLYAGAQDMMRYEILHRYGGFMADADAICLHPVDELLDRPRAYTVYDRPETDRFRGVCPILACEPGNPFVGAVIDRLAEVEPWELRKAEVSTGNRFLMSMIRRLKPSEEQLHIWPTHYFVPWQKSDPSKHYDGPDRVYAEQKWATSTYAYNREGGPGEEVLNGSELAARRRQLLDRLIGARRQVEAPGRDADADVLQRQTLAREASQQTLTGASFRQASAELGTELEAAVAGPDGPSTRFHGLHMFRHKQNHPLGDSKLRSRSAPIRSEILGWMACARRVLMLGLDTGHLATAALEQTPDLRITALDDLKWAREGEVDPPDAGLYVPAAIDWLEARYRDRFVGRIGTVAAAVGKGALLRDEDDPVDLLLLPDIRARSFAALCALHGRLPDRTLILCASSTGEAGAEMADRLLLQGMCYRPLARQSFGRGNGSLSVVRLRRG